MPRRELAEIEIAEAELRSIQDAVSCGLIVLSTDWLVLRMNPVAEAILGWRTAELQGRPARLLWSAVCEDGSPFSAEYEQVTAALRAGNPLRSTILGICCQDGQRRWLQLDIVPAFHADGTPSFLIISFFDITERKLSEDVLCESEARYRLLFDRNPHPTWVNDRETQEFLVVNEAALRHYGYTREEFLSMTARQLRPPEDVAEFVSELTAPAVSRFAKQWRHQKKDGSLIYVEVDSHPLMFAGRPARVAVVTDITERKQAEEALAHRALYDMLTDLPNRALLHERLRRATRGETQDVTSAALLIMDLDRFKEVNDTFGHHYGDLLLRQVGERLQGVLRGLDMLARLGGDEFAVVLPGADRAGAEEVAQRLLRALDEPFTIEGHDLAVGASIGIALCPEHASDADALLQRADVAMYVAKRSGDGHAVYALDQDDNSPGRLALTGELRRAIEHDELLLHYQPKLDMRDCSLVGVEALVRWQHPQRGFLPPGEFIALAEQTGLIYPLSRWVLEAALKQQQAWRASGLDVPVAVNLSRRTLHDPELPAMVAQLLARWDVAPSALVLEITESTLMADPVRAGENLSHLRALGVRMSIDDFGTGYSSLASLKNLSVDELKIDQSFVQAMATDPSSRAIVRAIIDLADALQLHVVAEGVEDQATWDMLAGLGCQVAQGYFLSRPMAAAGLSAWVVEVGSAWLAKAEQADLEDALQDRIRGRGARLIAEDEFIARKQAEAALRASEERSRLALQAAGMGTWDIVGRANTWSTVNEALNGLAPGTYDGTFAGFRRSVHPDDWPALHVEIQAALAERRDSLATYRTIWPDGSVHWLESKGRALFDSDGAVIRVTGTTMDVTVRKHAEEALRASEERFRKQYKGIPLPTYSWLQVGDDFVLQDYNDAAEAISGGSVRDWVGTLASKRFAGLSEVLASLHACVAEQRTTHTTRQYCDPVTGRERLLRSTFVFVPPRTAMAHIEDVTLLEHAEQQPATRPDHKKQEGSGAFNR